MKLENRIRRLVGSGLSYAETAKKLKLTKGRVAGICFRREIFGPMRKRERTPVRRRFLQPLREPRITIGIKRIIGRRKGPPLPPKRYVQGLMRPDYALNRMVPL